MNNKTFPSYLFRKRKNNYNCDYWNRMWDFFFSIHVCQNEEQSESLTQPPVRTDIQDFKVAQTARKRPFPKTSKGEDGNRSLVYRCVFFHKQWGVTQQCGGSRTDECLRGGGLHMKCQALCRGSRWTVSGEWGGGGSTRENVWLSDRTTERGGGGGWKSVVLQQQRRQQQYAELE